jgi:SAM-dependent methyltransferase
VIDETMVALKWNENAPRWIAQVRRGLDTLAETLNNPAFFDFFVPNLRGLDILDLGCGEGRNTRLLARRGARMTGIDIAARMIEAAQCTEEEEPLGIRYRVCSFTSLNGYADASFDAAISTMAFMDSPNFDRAAHEAFRVLRGGGNLYFSVLHPCFWTRGSRWVSDADGHDEGMLVTDYWLNEPYIEEGRFAFVRESEAPSPSRASRIASKPTSTLSRARAFALSVSSSLVPPTIS